MDTVPAAADSATEAGVEEDQGEVMLSTSADRYLLSVVPEQTQSVYHYTVSGSHSYQFSHYAHRVVPKR